MRITFTAELIKGLSFERRPIDVDAHGHLVYDNQPLPAKVRDWTLRDAKQPGFGIRLTRGSKTFFVQRKRGGSTSDRYVLTEQHSLRAARDQAQEWIGRMRRGEDPRDEARDKNTARTQLKAREGHMFGHVYGAYMTGGVGLRPGTRYDRELAGRWLEKEPVWSVPFHRLNKADVHATFGVMMANAAASADEKHSGPRPRRRGPHADVASAWKALRHCSAAWTACDDTKTTANPFTAWRREHRKTLPKVIRRVATLPMDRESGVAWLKALVAFRKDSDHTTSVVADYFMCLLLWGGRRTEVQTLRWADIDTADATVLFRAEITKTRQNLWLPLTPWALEILAERKRRNEATDFPVTNLDWIFPSIVPSRHIVELRDFQKRLRSASGLWIGPHDLRRTLASHVFGDTKNLGTVGLALGHASSDANVTAGYVPSKERLRALRPVYENRERQLRQLIDLEGTADPLASLTSEQRVIVHAAEAMLRNAGIAPNIAAASWALMK